MANLGAQTRYLHWTPGTYTVHQVLTLYTRYLHCTPGTNTVQCTPGTRWWAVANLGAQTRYLHCTPGTRWWAVHGQPGGTNCTPGTYTVHQVLTLYTRYQVVGSGHPATFFVTRHYYFFTKQAASSIIKILLTTM